jgi:hypothetical protein
MINFFGKNKKPRIRFFSLIPAVNTLYPITLSSKLKRDWVEEEKKDFEVRKSKCPFANLPGLKSIGKCPAIKSAMNAGFVIYAPADFTINTTGDKVTLNVTQKSVLRSCPYVDVHDDTVSSWLIDPSKDTTVSQIIKVNTPWRVITDPDIIFIVTKVSYVKESRFTPTYGIFDPSISAEVNIQLMWHVLEATETVVAGTPLCQYVPVSRKLLFNSDYEIGEATINDYKMEDEMIYSGSHQFGTSDQIMNRIKKMSKILKKYGY